MIEQTKAKRTDEAEQESLKQGNSKYTPESIFLRVVSLYFSTRNWSDDKYIDKYLSTSPAYFALHKINIDTLLSALFPYEISLDESQKNY